MNDGSTTPTEREELTLEETGISDYITSRQGARPAKVVKVQENEAFSVLEYETSTGSRFRLTLERVTPRTSGE